MAKSFSSVKAATMSKLEKKEMAMNNHDREEKRGRDERRGEEKREERRGNL